MLTPDLPPITYNPPPITRGDQSGRAITPELKILTLAVSPSSFADAIRERIASRAIEELQRYGRFRAGWDGYRGRPFSKLLISQGVDIVKHATILSRVRDASLDAIIPGPASDGSIDVEFKRGDKTLAITMYPEATDAEVHRGVRGDETHHVVPNDTFAMVHELAWLFS